MHFTIRRLSTASRLTNERTNSLNLGRPQIGNNTQNEIDYHEQIALAAVHRYISA